MQSGLPLWLQYVQVLAVAIIAALAAWIAWKQMRIARTRLQIDLYEKRYGTFDATMKLLAHVAAHAAITPEALRDFAVRTVDAAFLFDDGMVEYLKDIRKKVIEFQTLKHVADPMVSGAERAAYMGKAYQRLNQLVSELDMVQDKFKPWLRLEQRGSKLSAWSWERIRQVLRQAIRTIASG